MGRIKKDKIHMTIKIDRELKLRLNNYPNIEKSALINKLLWSWMEQDEHNKKYI